MIRKEYPREYFTNSDRLIRFPVENSLSYHILAIPFTPNSRRKETSMVQAFTYHQSDIIRLVVRPSLHYIGLFGCYCLLFITFTLLCSWPKLVRREQIREEAYIHPYYYLYILSRRTLRYYIHIHNYSLSFSSKRRSNSYYSLLSYLVQLVSSSKFNFFQNF